MMQNRPKIIGLTGGSGVGKGEVCRILGRSGAEIIDTDSLSHKAILRGNPAYDEIIAHFGGDILAKTGEIDRKKLGAIVFSDKSQLDALSKIVHKYVQIECENIIQKSTAHTVVIDAPALVEANMQGHCDLVIGIFARKDLRIARIMARDGITLEAAQKRIESQMPDDVLKTFVDIVIDNNSSLSDLEEKLREI